MKLPRNKQRRRNRWRIAFNPANSLALLRLRRKHAGQQCVVLATGPSLNRVDLSLIAEHPNVVGVNGIYRTRNNLKYYFVSCPSFYLSNEADIERVDAENTFLSSHIPYRARPRRSYLQLYEKKFIYSNRKFHTNLLRPLYGGPTVILDIVLPTLIWMGFSEIILVGADYSLTDYRHFYPEEEHKVIKPVDCEDEMVLAHQSFAVVKQHLDSTGQTTIINSSPGSDLPFFQKIALEQAVRPK